MISAKLLNSEASLNDYFFIESINFVPGENVTVNLQIYLNEKSIRYIPPVAATMTLTFIDSTGADVDKTATVIDADDRSMWTASVSQVESATLSGQNIEVTLDVNGDGTVIYKTIILNAFIRNNLAGDC
jgi:hypothetical protein